MKRSQINNAIKNALILLEKNNMKLPQFAYWKLDEWAANSNNLSNLKKIMLGWDVTDFGSGKFENVGATLFTVRNGHPEDKNAGTPYAEKLIFLSPNQEVPFHFHKIKTEDIINRGGTTLFIELYNSTDDGMLDKKSPVEVKMDGIIRTFPAGCVLEIEKGNSITLTPKLHHRFWNGSDGNSLIVGEISSINDDFVDNVFISPANRYAVIDEDEPAYYHLCNE